MLVFSISSMDIYMLVILKSYMDVYFLVVLYLFNPWVSICWSYLCNPWITNCLFYLCNPWISICSGLQNSLEYLLPQNNTNRSRCFLPINYKAELRKNKYTENAKKNPHFCSLAKYLKTNVKATGINSKLKKRMGFKKVITVIFPFS